MQSFLPQSVSVLTDLDNKLRRKLAASLEHLFERVGSALGGGVEGEIGPVLSAIRARRQKPSVFACYFELVFALKAGRDDEAAHLWRRIVLSTAEPAVLAISPLNEEALGEDADRFTRLLNAAETAPIFAPPDPALWSTFEANLAEALSLLEEAAPALETEVRGLVTQIIAAQPRDASVGFGGVSSLTLWGAVTLNAAHHRTPLDLLEALVHEGAHLLLFGYAADEPLVRNPLSQRFASPLRREARPMDGVYHATFVCARLHYLYRRLLDGRPAALADWDPRRLEARLAQRAAGFDDGAGLIADQAILTPTGERVLRATVEYMSHAAA